MVLSAAEYGGGCIDSLRGLTPTLIPFQPCCVVPHRALLHDEYTQKHERKTEHMEVYPHTELRSYAVSCGRLWTLGSTTTRAFSWMKTERRWRTGTFSRRSAWRRALSAAGLPPSARTLRSPRSSSVETSTTISADARCSTPLQR